MATKKRDLLDLVLSERQRPSSEMSHIPTYNIPQEHQVVCYNLSADR